MYNIFHNSTVETSKFKNEYELIDLQIHVACSIAKVHFNVALLNYQASPPNICKRSEWNLYC